jgi:hypothetical protein
LAKSDPSSTRWRVRHEEIGQDLADRRHERVGAVDGDALHQLIVGPFKVGKEAARLDEIKLQPVLERRLEAVRRDERLGERLFERFRCGHERLLAGERRTSSAANAKVTTML